MTLQGDDMTAQAERALKKYLDNRGLRQTQERVVILRSVCQLRQFTPEQLEQSITSLRISRATVYNTISLLIDAGIIHKLEKSFGQRAGGYEVITGETASFIHVICERCGRVSTLKDPTVTRILADKKYSNFTAKRYSLYIYGACKVCRRKSLKEGGTVNN